MFTGGTEKNQEIPLPEQCGGLSSLETVTSRIISKTAKNLSQFPRHDLLVLHTHTLRGLSPRAKLVPTFAGRGVSRGQRNGSPRPLNSVF
jgi:hypothetical protein